MCSESFGVKGHLDILTLKQPGVKIEGERSEQKGTGLFQFLRTN